MRALIKYQSGEALPKMDGMTNLVFSMIRQQIDYDNQKYEDICEARKAAGAQGGRPSKSLMDKGDKPKKANGFLEKQTKAKKAESESDNDTDIISPLFIPPQSGEKTNPHEDKFFTLYPRYAKDRSKMREDVDYKRLLEEFGKSSYLRSLYTVKQINDNYALIIQGDFRDKENPLAGFEARAERDRWYSERRAQAEREADDILNRFMQDEGFKTVHKRLKELECEIGKTEAKAESGDFKACKQLVKLTQEQSRRRMEYVGIIERNGKQEEDLYPKWHCPLCEDTGYLENGMACDCYEKEKEWKTC
jgi:hypothetical protein